MIVLIGPSGSCKNEIAKNLLNYKNMKKVMTATTRKPRPGEVNEEDYYFLTENKFNKCLEENRFIETTEYNGFKYGTPIKEVGINKVLIIDPKGLEQIRNSLDKETLDSLCVFYIKSKRDFRENRLLNRGFTLEEANRSIIQDNYNFKDVDCNFVIDIDRCNLRVIGSRIYFLYQLFLNKEFSRTPKKTVKNCIK